MAVLKALPTKQHIDMLDGSIDFYVHKGQVCARTWPRLHIKTRSQPVQDQWEPFRYINQIYRTLPENIKQAYDRMAGGTSLSGKDLAVRCYINGSLI